MFSSHVSFEVQRFGMLCCGNGIESLREAVITASQTRLDGHAFSAFNQTIVNECNRGKNSKG